MGTFVGKDPKLGFDPGPPGAVPWQMVPLGGARGIKLLHGERLTVAVNPMPGGRGVSGGLTYSETSLGNGGHREIWLQGRKAGRYLVSAINSSSGADVAWLTADVVEERRVKIAYYFLPIAVRWEVKKLHDLAGAILSPQANVGLEFVGAWGNENGESIQLPKEADLSDPKQRSSLWDYGNNWNADLMVYFCRKITGSDKHFETAGQTLGNQILINSVLRQPSEYARMARTLAHEIGHFVSDSSGSSHDDKASDLMFSDSAHSPGTMVRRARCLRVIR